MLRTVVEARTLVAMMVAACVGTWGLRTHPVDHENLFLALIAAKDPTVFHVLTYGYATNWFYNHDRRRSGNYGSSQSRRL